MTVQRKQVLAGTITAILGTAIALPFAILHPALPFTILLIGFGVTMALRQRLRLPKYLMAYLTGCLVALVVLLPAVSVVKFVEQGLDDGPFYGLRYAGGVTGLQVSHRIDYRQGELLIYNREAHSAPVLAYQVNDEMRWARVMDVSQHPKYRDYLLSTIEEPTLSYGLLRDRLNFLGTWNFGKEQGRAYLWKWRGFHRFYLSW